MLASTYSSLKKSSDTFDMLVLLFSSSNSSSSGKSKFLMLPLNNLHEPDAQLIGTDAGGIAGFAGFAGFVDFVDFAGFAVARSGVSASCGRHSTYRN